MKRVIWTLLIVIFVINIISADELFYRNASIPELINSDNPVLFSEENGFAVQGNKIFITYVELLSNGQELVLLISDDYGSTFEKYVFYELSNNSVSVEPTLAVSEDGICNIFFVISHRQTQGPKLYNVFFENGEFSDIQEISDNVIGDISIHQNDNNVFLTTSCQLYTQLCDYMYFTNNEISTLTDDPDSPAARVRFWGRDELHGKVHSNSNIWIQNAGSPAVNPSAPNWPWFHDKVTTAGQIFIYQAGSSTGTPLPGSCPVNLVFEGGYQENVDPIEIIREMPLSADAPFGWNTSDVLDIFLVQINGTTIDITIGDIVETETKAFTVYDFYPDALIKNPDWSGDDNNHPHLLGDSLFTNYITMKDTIWTTAGSIALGNSTLYLPGTVWISGTVTGKQTIYAKGDVYIIGNIAYTNTPVGQSPEDNETDYFGLVSEKSIYIKYKYRDPFTNEIISAPMSTGPNGNIYLYGAYAALGERGEGPWGYKEEGVFSYEYQHPHGSPTPFWGQSAYTGNDTLFSFIDLHRIKYPPNRPTYGIFNNLQWPGANANASYAGYPMANHPLTNLTTSPHYAVYDYPWYNPVYPESADDIVYERGTLNLFGSILQMRRGFMRRSGGGTSDNPDTDNYWDIDNYVFGPTHQPTGYDKQYIYDSRLQNSPLPWFPSAFIGKKYFSLLNYDLNNQTTEINNFDDPENLTEKRVIDTASENDLLSIITSEINDEETLFKLLFSSDFGQTYAEYELSNPMNFYKDICLKNNMAYILYYDNNIDNCFKLGIFSFANSTLSHINLETPAYFSADFNYTLLKTQDGILLITDFTGQDENNQRQIYEITDEFSLNYLNNFNLDFLEDSQIKALSYQTGINDTLYTMIKTTDSIEEPSANIYLSKIYVNGFTPIDDEIIIAGDTFTVSTYPNPFNPTTAIEFYLPEQDNINLSIFNVKGQKIITLHNDVLDKGLHTFIFNGKDEKGNNLSSGIYFMRISGNKYLHNKKIILLK